MKIITLLLVSLGCSIVGYGQSQIPKVEKCESAVKGGKYKWASIEPVLNEPNNFYGYVLVKPKDVNRQFLVRLAKRLNSEYCKAERFQVVIFDEGKYANPVSMQELVASKGKIVRMRGFYSFDRKSGENRLEFSTARGHPTTEVKLNLSEDQ